MYLFLYRCTPNVDRDRKGKNLSIKLYFVVIRKKNIRFQWKIIG